LQEDLERENVGGEFNWCLETTFSPTDVLSDVAVRL
jgi:hypothetical protein